MVAIETDTKKLFNSAGELATGFVLLRLPAELETGDGLMLTTRGRWAVKAGVFVDGATKTLPAGAEVEIVHVFNVDDDSGRGVRKDRTTRWVEVPAGTTLEYVDLITDHVTVPPAAGPGVPAWAAELLEAIGDMETLTDTTMTAVAADEDSAFSVQQRATIAGEVVPTRNNAARSAEFGAPQHEDETTYTYPTRINFGDVEASAAVAVATQSRNLDIIAHWYNDFGLEYVASSSTAANGWFGWYDWRWNFPSDGDYDPQRHPLQGFYQGDDPDVLDWQCKWLAETGVNALSLVPRSPNAGFTRTGWATPANGNHWIYQLFTNVKNFQALRYVLWGGITGDVASQIAELTSMYEDFPNGYVHTENGKAYPVIFLWDGELLRGTLDAYSGKTNTVAHLIALSNAFKAIGYDGVMVLARNAGLVYTEYESSSLPAADVLYVSSDYAGRYTDPEGTGYDNLFSSYAERAPFPTGINQVPVVQTSALSHPDHPSTFPLAGSTPELFGLALRRAADSIVKNKQRRLLLINNIAEWAESGPGLIPNVQDGFGYLDQVRALPAAPPMQTVELTGNEPDGLYERVVSASSATSMTVNVPSWARRIEVCFAGSATSADYLRMRLNGDTGANYDSEYTRSQGSSAPTSIEELAATSARVGLLSASSGIKTVAEVRLENGGPSGFNRTFMARAMRTSGTATGDLVPVHGGGTWRSSAKITSVTFLAGAGNFRDGSELSVYCWR